MFFWKLVCFKKNSSTLLNKYVLLILRDLDKSFVQVIPLVFILMIYIESRSSDS